MQFTKRTIISRTALAKKLGLIRKNEYAIDNEEHEIGVRCAAAPIYDSSGEVIAALSISAPSVRMTGREIPRYAQIVVQAASGISRRLGHKENVNAFSASTLRVPR